VPGAGRASSNIGVSLMTRLRITHTSQSGL
jgi:hypothetical protein